MNPILQIAGLFAVAFSSMVLRHYARVPLRNLVHAFRRAATYKKTCIVVTGLFPIVVRLLLLPVMPVPQPGVDDEFSYLLGADTFASGRLTNPPLPLWVHFETLHEISQPTYMTKYPPMQSLFLGFGQRVFGHPWAGVLLSIGLMCGGLCWMLQGWLPPAWALLGTLIATLQFGIFQYWTNSYWGGAVAAFGGALLLGAVGRIQGGRYNAPAMGFVMGLGISLLANSRPLEGALLTTMAGVWLVMKRRFRWIPAAAAVLVVCAAFMAYYNYRGTGSPFLLPYELHERQYAYVPSFIYFQPHRTPPVYHHKELRQYWVEWDESMYEMCHSDPLSAAETKILLTWIFFVRGGPLSLALVAIPLLWTSHRWRFPLIAVAIYLSFMLIYKATLPHYIAPLTGFLVLLLMLGIHRLTQWRPQGQPTGKLLVTCVLAATFVQFPMDLLHPPPSYTADDAFKNARKSVIDQLTAVPGKHLAILRYGPKQPMHREWVFNAANIDNSRIVWAREMTPDEDRPLFDHFRDRDVWLVQPNGPGPLLSRYESGDLAAAKLSR
jgi:hypothetical protein